MLQEYKKEFERDGFVVIDWFFAIQELQDFSTAFQRLAKSLEGKEAGELYDAAFMLPEFLRIVGKRTTAMIINDLLNRPYSSPLYCFTNRCRIDPPNDNRRTYGWHQEVFYTLPESRFIQTWAPLIRDTTVENGTIEICVGSHKEGIARQSWNERLDGGATQILVDSDVVNKYEQRAIPMKLGQMMFFDSRLFHRSGQNTSNETRYSLVGMYHDVDAPGFRVPTVRFGYRGKSPAEYFAEQMSPNV